MSLKELLADLPACILAMPLGEPMTLVQLVGKTRWVAVTKKKTTGEEFSKAVANGIFPNLKRLEEKETNNKRKYERIK